MAEVLGVAGLIIGIPGLIDVSVKYCRFISGKLQDYQAADKQLRSMYLLLELHRSNLEESLTLVQQAGEALGEHVRELLTKVLLELHSLLAQFAAKLESSPNKQGASIKKLAFAFSLKSELRVFLEEFEAWHDRFMKRMYMVGLTLLIGTSTSSPAVPSLTSSPSQFGGLAINRQRSDASVLVFNTSQLLPQSISVIPGTGMSAASLQHDKRIIIEYRYFRKSASFPERQFHKRSVQDIASMLRRNLDESTVNIRQTGLLQCLGYFEDDNQLSRYALVHEVPCELESTPRTLHSLLCDPENRRLGVRHDLSDRVRLANSIATAILSVHTAGFVHKNIRPTNILVFDPAEGGKHERFSQRLGTPFLVGFDQSRLESAESEHIADDFWENNIYRHPSRQGLKPGVKYSMLHDIYSLGVIFLEIALWKPLFMYDKNLNASHNDEFWGSLIKKRVDADGDPVQVQVLYRRMAKGVIPRTMGGKFAAVVDSCLACVEEGFEDAQEDEVVMGLAYIDKILEKLEKLVPRPTGNEPMPYCLTAKLFSFKGGTIVAGWRRRSRKRRLRSLDPLESSQRAHRVSRINQLYFFLVPRLGYLIMWRGCEVRELGCGMGTRQVALTDC